MSHVIIPDMKISEIKSRLIRKPSLSVDDIAELLIEALDHIAEQDARINYLEGLAP